MSLKGRALKYLAAREHSRAELARKLTPHAESSEQLVQLLDELEQKGWLSAQRFAESVVHRKGARYGVARLRSELRQHQLPVDVASAAIQALQDSEFQRAHELWSRRFGAPPHSPQEKARQMRFLLGRGFESDVVHRVIRGDGLATEE